MRYIVYQAFNSIDDIIESLPPGYQRHRFKMKRFKMKQWFKKRYGVDIPHGSFRYMIRKVK